MPGYPSGSLVAYALDADGCPVVQLSALAEHTKNISRDLRVSLTVADVKKGDIQNSPRLTLLADAVKLTPVPDGTRERYYARFPAAREYDERLDFSFYKLTVLKARFIGGFGRIANLDPEEFKK